MSSNSGVVSDRRRFIKQVGSLSVASLFLNSDFFAQQLLTRTPEQTEGPFYPTTLPLDTDNDLMVINGSLTAAVGQITYLSGRILSAAGEPVRNAYMEIWQADNTGAYIHPQSTGFVNRDQNFQGFGRFLTGSSGEYLFRTVRPGLYPGRTRHIHFKVMVPGQPTLTSQLYVLGEAQNSGDGVLNGINDTKARNSVIVPFIPIGGSAIGALAARFDVVLSVTPSVTPSLTVTNVTNPTRTSFLAGDSWRLDARNGVAGANVYLHLWRNNVDLGVSGPYGVQTDGTGSWSLSGSFGSGDVGLWQLQAVFGSAASSQVSTPVDIRIVNS